MSQLPYHSKFPRTQEMKVESEKLEDEFWHDLEKLGRLPRAASWACLKD